ACRRLQDAATAHRAWSQVIADSSMYRGLRTLPAVTSACGRHPLVVGNLIVRGGAFMYQRHCLILSLRPRFAPGPFSFENCCYRASQSGPHRGFTLGENAFDPLAGNPPGMGRAEAIAPTARAAPNLHALLRDTEQLRDLTGGIVVE